MTTTMPMIANVENSQAAGSGTNFKCWADSILKGFHRLKSEILHAGLGARLISGKLPVRCGFAACGRL